MVQGVELSSLATLSSAEEDTAISARQLLKRHFLSRVRHYLPQIQQAAVALTDVPPGEALKPYWCGTIPPSVLSLSMYVLPQ